MIRVLVVAAYASVRAGLRAIVEGSMEFSVVGEASGGRDLEALSALARPDVALLDLNRSDPPDGLPPDLAVVALVDGPEDVRTLAERQAGWACLLKDAEPNEIRSALQAVDTGLIVVDPSLWPAGAQTSVLSSEVEALTSREREVLQLMAEGLPNKGIAHRLGISLHTVKFHAASLFAKLGAASRTEAVTQGLRNGLVSV